MRPSVLSILSSNKTDEEASIELLELVGLDEFDLVSEIMMHRREAVIQVRNIRIGHKTDIHCRSA